VVHDTAAIVSLWIGVLSCVELELEKDKSSKRRRSSAIAAAAAPEAEIGDKRVLLKETTNVK
jgi:DNA damage-binding protein 1